MNITNIDLKNIEVESDVREVKLDLPFGEIVCKIDFLSGLIAERFQEIGRIFLKMEKGELQDNEEALNDIDKLKNALDYVYGIDVCNEIYKHIPPFSKVAHKGLKAPFCYLILQQVQNQINAISQAEVNKAKKEKAKEFRTKYA